MATIASTSQAAIAAQLRGVGLRLDYGAISVCVRSSSSALAEQLRAVYPEFSLEPPGPFTDVHVVVARANGLRRFVRPQVRFVSDGRQEFHPFPADTALPMFEWGVNWLIGQRVHHRMLLHAGALERDGLGLLLPALPGSGKSTLTAALSLRGWRLLSDEFGVCDPDSLELESLIKPVVLKNRSIDVVRAFAPSARMGPRFPKTRKGDVAHVAAGRVDVERRHETARPAMVMLPRWRAGSPTVVRAIDAEEMFRALAFNSFNYAVLGSVGFEAAIRLVRQCVGWQIAYSDVEDAIRVIDELWQSMRGSERAASQGRLDAPSTLEGRHAHC